MTVKKTAALLLLVFIVVITLRILMVAEQPPNVLLVTIDTLRADHLASYGNREIQTPTLDALAASGVQFDNALSHSPQTLPSHLTILSGTYSSYHQVRENGSFFKNEKIQTIARLLQKAGYRTAAFTAAFVLDSRFGLNKGFETYDNVFADSKKVYMFGYQQCKAEKVIDHAIDWIDGYLKVNNDTPFFNWVHLFDPHREHEPPEPFLTKYRNNLYDGEIAYADSQLGRLIEHLKHAGLYDDTLIIVTSDHGEGLGEHNELTHSTFVYRTTQHIPLIIKLPEQRFAGRKIPDLVRHIDILPTMLKILGLEDGALEKQLQGESLLPLMEGKSQLKRFSYAETYYPYYMFGWCPPKAYEDARFKFIDLPLPELYDLRSDPHEIHNIYAEHKDLAANFKSIIARTAMAKSGAAAVRDQRKETIDRLKTLGYAHGSVSAGDAGDIGSCSDPKKGIKNEMRLHEMETLIQFGHYERAMYLVDQLIAANPRNVKARWDKANLFILLGDIKKAEAELLEIKRIKSDHVEALLQLVNLYMNKIPDLKKAKEQIDDALDFAPHDPVVWLLKGDLETWAGDHDEAIKSYNKSESLGENSADLYQSKGAWLLTHNRLKEAEPYLKKAVKLRADFAEAHFDLGVLYDMQGNNDEALKAYHLAISLKTDESKYYTKLAELYLKQAKHQKSIEILERALAFGILNPSIQYNLGTTYLMWGKPEKAVKPLQKAIESGGNLGPAYANLGVAYSNMGDDKKSYEMARKSVVESPEEPAYWLNLAHAAYKIGKKDEIAEYIKTSLKKGMDKEKIEQDPILKPFL